MNKDTFLKFLQSIITMADENDSASVAGAKAILKNLIALMRSSGMANGEVLRMAVRAGEIFDGLVQYKEDFAGKPGDVIRNKQKRDRLAMALYPHC